MTSIHLLAKSHLRIEKGESGGYTVLAIDHNIRVKASDVFRQQLRWKDQSSGRPKPLLGPGQPASTSASDITRTHTGTTTVRNSALREERKAQRHADRAALMAEYNQYRNRQREVCKAITTDGREGRQYLLEVLRQQKKEIRASALSWPAKKILLSQAAAQSVLEVRRSEAVHSTEAAGGISEESPLMGCGQRRRRRCAGGRTTSRMALCGPTQSTAARRDAGSKRTAYRAAAGGR